ncbi:PREDICTED: adrenocortical dysplasia protein homolog [Elephantulus edwardii]|uniref:adrenocortical dysplasia protein homolog n=1 Tax=Elephantulus edwardii TaxID=28737 RepID=UPI0003F0ECA2|nr:PREDICTED: adrenocortical dysplasia protein homolog [Elephantulus edwardii]
MTSPGSDEGTRTQLTEQFLRRSRCAHAQSGASFSAGGGGAAAPAGKIGTNLALMAADTEDSLSLDLQPWIRELVLAPEEASGSRIGQLLEVLQEAETPDPSCAPDMSDVWSVLLVSDGTHAIRCLLTRKAMDTSDWEKEFGFHEMKGRLLVLNDFGVRIQVAERGAASEFYLQVDRFSLLPEELPLELVANCNQDRDVQKKLHECLEEHLSEPTSPDTDMTLSQLLNEVEEDQEHPDRQVCQAENCLMLAGPGTAPQLTRWAALRCKFTGEAVYSVPGPWLHISKNEQIILNFARQGPDLLSPDSSLQDLSLTLTSSSSSSPSSTDPVQGDNSLSLLAICPLPSSQPHSRSPQPSSAHNSPPLSCSSSLLSLDHVPSPHQACITRAQKRGLEFKGKGQNPQLPSRTSTIKGALGPKTTWSPPKRHRDGSPFQYVYPPPCTSLCAQVQAVRLPSELVAWALHFVSEPPPDSEPVQM